MANNIEIYTDGSCLGNPGPGGVGIVLNYKEHSKEMSEGYELTTNNRMELLAVIIALESLLRKDLEITIYSDSKYVVDAVEKGWLNHWVKKNFKKKKNKDLWLRFLDVYKLYDVKFIWVKGHATNKYNNICDKLAVKAAHSDNLKKDFGYEKI